MLIRGIGLRGAVAVNVITMIGIGPLITIPLVLNDLHGALALWAWVVGALIALCDGLVWAELGSLYPGSGGTYAFLRETFGRERLGRMLAFLFSWQIVLSAPLLLASGYIGFAHYAAYLWPALADWRLQGIVGSAVALVTVALLYRPIGGIARTGIALGVVAVATLAAVVLSATTHFSRSQAFGLDPHLSVAAGLAGGLGPALIITLYDYYGYGQSCTLGDEVQRPERNLPRSIVISVLLVGALYVLLQIGVLGAVPWSSLVAATAGGNPPPAADYVASTVVEGGWGILAARIVTVAILVTAFASTFGNLLGYSRIPYAAARDGLFFAPFARVHEGGRFPHVALLVVGLLAVPFCFLPLGLVINALTTGLVIIQSIGQIAALVALRLTGRRAPYRMWLFPLPAFLAFVGWIYIFCSAGNTAIAFGVISLGGGIVAYLVLARIRLQWPFAARTAIVIALCALAGLLVPARASAAAPVASPSPMPAFTHAAIAEQDGFPVFEVDGNPFFVYGAAFFYERIPRADWPASMYALKRLGINTLDLYVMWNWHEPKDGSFDFDGHTNSRRDLRALLKLAREERFKLIVRPGPVIRNEWRNGGYPAWLLSRPEYGMPLHDLLEGRYPPTATLQNAHSDDAAVEWMRNTTHMRYSSRWIRRALEEFRPYADLVLAVALDDDQGAYLDNQTWPAPHLTAYLNHLKSVVHSVTGPKLPVFINTYQMKVTASSPVWAMGNWYQSDAYSIGEHDRAQLEFSTGLLQTRPHQPLMYSEFQAGWLLGPDDIRPRPADPSNTLLAMTTLLGMGVRGIVNFPAQDTLYPAGWEAPFANWFYAWDAALGLKDVRQSRFTETKRIGDFVWEFGDYLASARPVWDAGIAYPAASYAALTGPVVDDLARKVLQAQQACRAASAACRLIDPRLAGAGEMRHLPVIFVPRLPRQDIDRVTTLRLERYAKAGGTLYRYDGYLRATDIDAAFARSHHRRVVSYAPGATFAGVEGNWMGGFFFLPNYSDRPLELSDITVTPPTGDPILIPHLSVPPRGSLIEPIRRLANPTPVPENRGFQPYIEVLRYPIYGDGIPLRADTQVFAEGHVCAGNGMPKPNGMRASCALPAVARGAVIVFPSDIFVDGSKSWVLENALVRLIVSPDAGARAFVFEDIAAGRSVFTTVGALRDDVAVEPPLSKTDRIAAYTHQFPAGMFNRSYRSEALASGKRAAVRFSYDAPDVLPRGARFERTVTLLPDARSFQVDERATFRGDNSKIRQRAVSVTSLAVGDSSKMTTQIVLSPLPTPFTADRTVRVTTGNTLGFYDTVTHELATIAWRPGDVESAQILERHFSIVVRLTLAPGRTARTTYGYWFADSIEAARRQLAATGAAARADSRQSGGPAPALANVKAR
jgi:amino acid transporter